ncbi:MAG: Asp-tRNA(Asn)/Glu-tRNA(Gln) amidotransferase GatCAB subunit B, partial [Chloroflexi bacterium]|nr:Asp-tRNA(Asn)/Glu-tRNA(Gln) amidotransferase GatCAB subunit B [Chloroflexota bacterium]
EIERQIQVYESGGRVAQETRGWIEEKGITVSQRSKEYAHDYRYFPEPDLPPLMISRQLVEEVRARLPELPDARRARFVNEFGLSSTEAGLLTASKAMADYFEGCVTLGSEGWQQHRLAKTMSNWLLGEFSRLLNAADMEISQAKVLPGQLLELAELVEKSTISITQAKTVFEEMFSTGSSPQAIVSEKGLTQISDGDALAKVVQEVLQANAQAVADVRAGKQQAMTFLVGQVMKATKGRANPGLVNTLLQSALGREEAHL